MLGFSCHQDGLRYHKTEVSGKHLGISSSSTGGPWRQGIRRKVSSLKTNPGKGKGGTIRNRLDDL